MSTLFVVKTYHVNLLKIPTKNLDETSHQNAYHQNLLLELVLKMQLAY